MAQADVEIVREFTQRFAAGGHVTDDYFDPEIVWDTSSSGLPSASVYHGREGVRRFFRDWLAPWTDYAIEAREIIDAGSAVVLVFRQAGTGRGSGARIERDFVGVWELENSKVVRFRLFASREQAFEAARTSVALRTKSGRPPLHGSGNLFRRSRSVGCRRRSIRTPARHRAP